MNGLSCVLRGLLVGQTAAYLVGSAAVSGVLQASPLDDPTPLLVAVGNDPAIDDATHIQAAIDTAVVRGGVAEVYLPARTYSVNRTIRLRSNLRIYGAGHDDSRIVTTGQFPIFNAQGSESERRQNIEVHDLGFEGKGGNVHAIRVAHVSQVIVRNNQARNIGLFISGLGSDLADERYGAIRSWDGLNEDIQIIGNDASGILDTDDPGDISRRHAWGIMVRYARNVTISENQVHNYIQGIFYWGGDAAGTQGYVRNPRWARNIRIESNAVSGLGNPNHPDPHCGLACSGAGITGAMGEEVTIRLNRAWNCLDYCIGVEGTKNARITENTAWDAGNGVVEVGFHSVGVVISGNTLRQSGRLGNRLFGSFGAEAEHAQVSIRVSDNRFEYTGESGLGVLAKGWSGEFHLRNNLLTNAVIAMDGNNNGAVEVRGNQLVFTRSTDGNPAILVGRTHGASARVQDNQVTMQGSVERERSAPGIRVYQDDYNSSVYTAITGNRISGFARAIEVEGNSANLGMVMRFDVRENIADGSYQNTSPCHGNGNSKGRTRLANNSFGGTTPSVCSRGER